MPSLANLMEDYRNWRGRQDWEQGKGWQDFFGGDSEMQERAERFGGFGTGSHGVGGLAGMIKASHGSPHLFDKFDFTKIGSGEGAQAYGHGGYFAQGFDSPVAKEYRDKLSGDSTYVFHDANNKPVDINDILQNRNLRATLQNTNGDIDATIARANELQKIIPGTQGAEMALSDIGVLEQLKQAGGLKRPEPYLYNVELKWPDAAREAADPLGEHHLLDWYEPLSKQSESVKQAMRDYATLSSKEHYVQPETQLPVYIDEGISPDTTGKQFYDWLASHSRDIKGVASRQNASSDLKAFGIPGIKYFDEGSRAAKKGTRNYVMFDDRFPEIVSRNGVSLSDLLRR